MQRPLPPHITAGYQLGPDDLLRIRGLLRQRDQWIEFYQNKELEYSRSQSGLLGYIRELESSIRVPIQGYVSQVGNVTDYFADNWVGPEFQVAFRANRPLNGLQLFPRVPSFFPPSNHLMVSINGRVACETLLMAGREAEINIPMTVAAGEEFRLHVKAYTSFNCKEAGVNDDSRNLVFQADTLIFRH